MVAPVPGLPPGKAAGAHLLEVCQKRAIVPDYETLAQEGTLHEPCYILRLTCGNQSVVGKGSSKKKARHHASILMLQEMGLLPLDYRDVESTVAVDQTGREIANPVGKLTEWAHKRMLAPPAFTYSCDNPLVNLKEPSCADDNGSCASTPFVAEYTCHASIGTFEESRAARSKKVAKRLAAIALLETVMNTKASTPAHQGASSSHVVGTHADVASQVPPAEASCPIDLQMMRDMPNAEAIQPIESLNSIALYDLAKHLSKRVTTRCKKQLEACDTDAPPSDRCDFHHILMAIASDQRWNCTFEAIETGPKSDCPREYLDREPALCNADECDSAANGQQSDADDSDDIHLSSLTLSFNMPTTDDISKPMSPSVFIGSSRQSQEKAMNYASRSALEFVKSLLFMLD